MAISPVFVSVSGLTYKVDSFKNEVIESVVRVFFPTVEKLVAAVSSIQKEYPGKSKLYRQSVTNYVAVARTAMFAIGAEAAKQMAVNHKSPSLSSSSSSSEFFPVIVALSESTQTTHPLHNLVIQSALRVILPKAENALATERELLKQDPKVEIQTHIESNEEDPLKIAHFISREARRVQDLSVDTSSPSSSIVFDNDYFSPKPSPTTNGTSH